MCTFFVGTALGGKKGLQGNIFITFVERQGSIGTDSDAGERPAAQITEERPVVMKSDSSNRAGIHA
jgi:hypothetical protein